MGSGGSQILEVEVGFEIKIDEVQTEIGLKHAIEWVLTFPDRVSFAKIAARFEEYLDTSTIDEMGEPLIKTTSSNLAKSREVAARQREEQSAASYMVKRHSRTSIRKWPNGLKVGVIPLQIMVVPKVKG
jgi:hypothetical protein